MSDAYSNGASADLVGRLDRSLGEVVGGGSSRSDVTRVRSAVRRRRQVRVAGGGLLASCVLGFGAFGAVSVLGGSATAPAVTIISEAPALSVDHDVLIAASTPTVAPGLWTAVDPATPTAVAMPTTEPTVAPATAAPVAPMAVPAATAPSAPTAVPATAVPSAPTAPAATPTAVPATAVPSAPTAPAATPVPTVIPATVIPIVAPGVAAAPTPTAVPVELGPATQVTPTAVPVELGPATQVTPTEVPVVPATPTTSAFTVNESPDDDLVE